MEETFRKNILDRIEKAEKEVEAAKELPGYGEAYWQGVIDGLEQAYRLADGEQNPSKPTATR